MGRVKSMIVEDSVMIGSTDVMTEMGTKQVTLTDVNMGVLSTSFTPKSTPVDADTINLVDSADSNKVKKLSWTNIKATLKTYFDTLYQSILVSGINIKTINGASILGSGDISIGTSSNWQPPQIAIFAQSAPAFAANTGAGLYASLSGGAVDDVLSFNIPLKDGNAIAYDGSTIFLRMHVKLSALSLVADTVGLILSYTFVEVGDNSTTDVTTIAQQNTTFSLVPAGIESNINLANISGPAGSHTLQVNILRNSTGGSSDTYTGNLRVTSVELIKI